MLRMKSKFDRHNRARLLDWLAHYSDFHQPGYESGLLNFEEMEDFGPRSPLTSAKLERLDDPDAYRHHRILTEAVRRLERERWRLYERLLPVYFAEDPNPTLPYCWRDETAGSPEVSSAVDSWNEAVNFMHAHVRERLGKNERLKVQVPRGARGAGPAKVRVVNPRHEKTLDIFYSHLENSRKPVAIKKTAEECGYSRSRMYGIVKQAERV